MTAVVVDENVPIVANDVSRIENGKQPVAAHASDLCRLAVVRFLREVISTYLIVLDDGDVCFARYRKYLSGKGQPGSGDAFLRHIYDNAHNPEKTERVPLVLREADGASGFDAFPDDPRLASFDPADRIFVALALASARQPAIVNAVDSDYRLHREALEAVGVRVTELCPAHGKVGPQRASVPRRRARP